MAVPFLDFESDIQELEEQLEKSRAIQEKGKVDMSKHIEELEVSIKLRLQEIYSSLTPWQRVQVARHTSRPYTLAHIRSLTDNTFVELFGDRTVKDDKAMVGGFGSIDGKTVMLIGQQKGINTKMRQYRNFGMANPEGYRKALRLMKLAEKFNKPIITFIDTPGAFPGIEAEERGQGEAIARNIIEMMQLKVPIICVIIGEGASGGALGIGIGDKVFMLENTWYSVISPESCSTILWRTRDQKEVAAESLKLTPEDLLEQKLISGIIPEPLGGAHRDPETTFTNVKKEIKKHLTRLHNMDPQERIDKRIEKYSQMGVFNE
ncbi:MAG: acetyl-CoA carboxylase carboxyltransferase subunit alpha [Flavobacteriales bacterium]|nr:acetyl-CoA carboxylase carboxyltransferase subunit alpha [Flavobacteriales bacterium]